MPIAVVVAHKITDYIGPFLTDDAVLITPQRLAHDVPSGHEVNDILRDVRSVDFLE